MSDKTFAEDFLGKLKANLKSAKTKADLERAKTNGGGLICRVFNDWKVKIAPAEVEALTRAKKENWLEFSKEISKQMEPVIVGFFDTGKPTQFDTLYNTHFKGSGITRKIVREQIMSGIFTQYAEAVTEATSANTDASVDLSTSIFELAQRFQTPKDVKRSVLSTFDNPGPIKDHLKSLTQFGQKRAQIMSMEAVSRFQMTLYNQKKYLIGYKEAGNEKVQPLIDILKELEEIINAHPIDPADEPLEESLPNLLSEFSRIKEEINALSTEETLTAFQDAQKQVSKEIGVLETLLPPTIERLKKNASFITDLRLSMIKRNLGTDFSKAFEALDVQLNELKELVALLDENSILADQTQLAIEVISEIRQTLLEDAGNLQDKTREERFQFEEKISKLKQNLQKPLTNISNELLIQKEKNIIPEAILDRFESVLKAIGDFVAWLGYVSEGVKQRRLKDNVKGQLSTSDDLETQVRKASLTDKDHPAVDLSSRPSSPNPNLPSKLSKSTHSQAPLLSAFQKALQHDELVVNGKNLNEYAEEYHGFQTEGDILFFLESVVLKDVVGDKTKMLRYLKDNFHRDGLFLPATSAIQEALTKHHIAKLQRLSCTHEIEIISNESGFVIQEKLKADALLVEPRDSLYKEKPYQGRELCPNIADMHMLEADGAIEVDFSKNPAEPTLRALENTVIYGHRALALEMEKLRPPPIEDAELTDTEAEPAVSFIGQIQSFLLYWSGFSSGTVTPTEKPTGKTPPENAKNAEDFEGETDEEDDDETPWNPLGW